MQILSFLLNLLFFNIVGLSISGHQIAYLMHYINKNIHNEFDM